MPAAKLLIVVQGGLVQEVYITPGPTLRVCRIDWDSIEEGDVSDPAWVTWTPVGITQDHFNELLKAAETEHAKRRKCRYCNASLTDHDESRCPEKLWKNNERQFSRLLAHMKRRLTVKQKQLLARSMVVPQKKIDELLVRATHVAAAAEKL